jgi:hypothetical protein
VVSALRGQRVNRLHQCARTRAIIGKRTYYGKLEVSSEKVRLIGEHSDS